MIHVTERAKDALLRKKILANLEHPDVGLRLTASRDGRLGLVADRPKAGDEVVRHQDSTVLLVDPQICALVLTGRTMDCRRTDHGALELVLRRSSREDEEPDRAV